MIVKISRRKMLLPGRKSNLDATATVLEKRAAEPGTAESNDQVVEVRDVSD